MLTNLIELETANLITPDPEVEELLQQLANRAALPLQVIGLRIGLALAKAQSSVTCCRKYSSNYLPCPVLFIFFASPETSKL